MTQRFSIGNFNLRNLVPASADGAYHFFYAAEKHNYYPRRKQPEQSLYDRKIDWVAAQINAMACDIICFQEVFDLMPLRDALERSMHAGRGKLYLGGEPVFREESYRKGIARIYELPRIALWVGAEFDVKELRVLDSFPDSFDFGRVVEETSGRKWQIGLTQNGKDVGRFNRPVIRARIRMPARFKRALGRHSGKSEIILYVAHFKSKRPIQARSDGENSLELASNTMREAAVGQARSLVLRAIEAAALRSYIVDDLATAHLPVILVGDLNDGPHGTGTDISGGLSIDRLPLPGVEQAVERDLAADFCLYNAYDLQIQRTRRDVYYTHIHKGIHDTLDHVMVSSHFVPRSLRGGAGSPAIGKVGTLRVLNDHLVNSDLDDMRTDKVGKYLHTRSDHGQISVRLDWFEHEEVD